MKFLQYILIGLFMSGFNSVLAWQYRDYGFEWPESYLHLNYSTSSYGVVWSYHQEDDMYTPCPTQLTGTNSLWLTQWGAYKGGRSFATRCYPYASPEKDRAEIIALDHCLPESLRFGEAKYFGYAMKFMPDSEFPAIEDRYIHFMQVHQAHCGPKVPFTFSYGGNSGSNCWRLRGLAQDGSATQHLVTTNMVNMYENQWYRLIWKFKPAYVGCGYDGTIDLWVNDVHAASWTGSWGLEPGITVSGETEAVFDTLDMRCGIYRTSPQAKDQFVVYDEIKVADSYYEADPERDSILWNFKGGTDGWTVGKDISSWQGTNDCGIGAISGADPVLHSLDNLGLNCGDCPYIFIRLYNATPGTTASFYFTTTSDPAWTSTKQVSATIVANTPGSRIYRFNMYSNPRWTGTLKQLRFDPVNDGTSSGTFAVDYIDFSTKTLCWDPE